MSDSVRTRRLRTRERTIESREIACVAPGAPPVVLPGTLRRDPDGELRTAGGRVRVVPSRKRPR